MTKRTWHVSLAALMFLGGVGVASAVVSPIPAGASGPTISTYISNLNAPRG
ncbi:MAG: hypothetical protein QOE09_3372, partial [Ilumatobacteraceae bacterium]